MMRYRVVARLGFIGIKSLGLLLSVLLFGCFPSSQRSSSGTDSGRLVMIPQVDFLGGYSPEEVGAPVFSPNGSFVGQRGKSSCLIWSLKEGVYLGQFGTTTCAGWLPSCASAPIQTRSPPQFQSCRSISIARLSPDSQRVAVACPADPRIYIHDAHDGKLLSTLELSPKHTVKELCWGPAGIAAYITAVIPDDEITDGRSATVFFFPSLSKTPRHYDLDPLLYRSIVLDPLARYYFESVHAERNGIWLNAYDLEHDRPGLLGWGPLGRYTPVEISLEPGRWLPGKYPVWEMLEVVSMPIQTVYGAWRIFTVPGARGLRRDSFDDQKPEGAFRVLDDGKTVVSSPPQQAIAIGKDKSAATASVDPSGRFIGTGKNSLRRISDGEELVFNEEGGVRTARGVFDGSIEEVKDLVFSLGNDPLRAPIVHGDQVATLLHHPHLMDDFFDNKPVALPVLAAPLGLPPQLEVVAVREQSGTAFGLALTVRPLDGGDGVSLLRRFVEGHPDGAPLPARANQSIEVRIDLPLTACSMVRLYACNRPGYVCSRAFVRDVCPPGKQRPKLP